MVPTWRAQNLQSAVSQALNTLRSALEAESQFIASTAIDRVRVVMTDYGESVLLPSIVRAMQEQAPGMSIRVEALSALFTLPVDRLSGGDIDCAIGFFPQSAPPADRPLLLRALYEEPVVCVMRKRHPALRQRLTLRRYAALDHIRVVYPSGGLFGVLDTLLNAHGLERRSSISVSHFGAAPPLLLATDAVVTVPIRLARAYCDVLPLTMVPVPLAVAPFNVTLAWHHRTNDSPAQRWFRELVVSQTARIARTGGATNTRASKR